jgi:hypothetical protein
MPAAAGDTRRVRVRVLVGVLALAACGRVDFDATTGDGAAAYTFVCPSFASFCDDFETGDISKWGGSYRSPGGTLVVTTGGAHSGSHALDATMPAQGDGAESAVLEPIAGPPVTYAVRVWAYQPQPLIHYDAVLLLRSTTALHFVNVSGGGTQTWTATEDGAGGLVDHVSTQPVPTNQWMCVELDVTVPAAGAPSVEVSVDDVQVIAGALSDVAPVYDEIDVGVARADAAGSRSIVDDVVVATQHIGCN